jgi:TonB-linked SusC/RagA family outer membrane protein
MIHPVKDKTILTQNKIMKKNSTIYWRIMRITLIQAAFAMAFVGVTLAHDNFSQGLLDTEVSAEFESQSLKNVLISLEKQTSVKFAYSGSIVNLEEKISMKADRKKLSEILHELLSPRHIGYEEKNDYILLSPVYLISGTVKDSKTDVGIPGVNILVKGTATGATTDANGKFNLNADEGATLVFSFIGYKNQEVLVNNQTTLDVKLDEDVSQLSEVVVVGYGTQTKAEFTGAASHVSADALKDIPVQSFEQGLAGKAAGVSIAQPNGALNSTPVIRIRGINSVSLSSYPLIVVDGIPINTGNVSGQGTVPNNPLGDINPSDIESIDVLKDAASTSIYGSRAAAGVLLITTKSGKAGKAKVSYDGWVGVSNAVRLPTSLNAEEYMMIKNEAVENSLLIRGATRNSTTPNFQPTYATDGSIVDTNWNDLVYQTGVSQNHSLSVSGGSDATKYFVSTNYSGQQGILKKSEFTRMGVRFNLDHKVNEWLNLGSNVTYSNTFNSSTPTGSLEGNAFGLVGAARLALLSSPNVYAVNPDGTYNNAGAVLGMGNNANVSSNFYNVVPMLDLNTNTSANDRIIGNFYAGVKLLKGLNYKMTYAVDRLKIENVTYNDPNTGPGNPTGSATNTSRLTNNWNWTNTMSYVTSIATKHNVSALVGYDVQKFNNSAWGASRSVVSDPFFNEFQGSFGQITPSGNSLSERAFVSIFSRLTYDFNKKYFVNVNFRRDGNSALGAGKKYGNFGGVSGAWHISEEEFYKSSSLSDIMSSVKLRASWGRVGNGNLSDAYPSISLYNSALYGDAATFSFSQAGNPNLGWETSNQTNIGADIGFLHDRITLDVSYYDNNVNGLILNVPQAPSKGIPGGSISQNVGAMYNKGLELGITAAVVNNGKFSYNTNFNITFNKNRVTELFGGPNDQIIGTTATAAEASNVTRVGESVGSLFGAKTAGVNPANGRRIFIDAAGREVQYSQVAPTGGSLWTYMDGSAAPAITISDYQLIGNALPKYYGGFNNNFKYGNFDLGLNFTFAGGNYIMNGTKGTWLDQRFWNNTTDVLARWTTPGQITTVPRAVYTDFTSNGSAFPISENAEKGDFIRLQTASLGYKVPSKLFGKSGISSVRVYTQVLNAFVITNYSGVDPEISSNGNTNTTPGVDKNSLPQARTFTFGVNVGF